MASESKTTTDHKTIQKWAEARGGKPTSVKGTEKDGEAGLLRIDFPGYSGGDRLEEISWDEFFKKFDEKSLAFLYQEHTSSGEESRFFKLINRGSAEHKATTTSNGKTHTADETHNAEKHAEHTEHAEHKTGSKAHKAEHEAEHKTDSKAHKAEHEAEHKTDGKTHKAEHETEHKTGSKAHEAEHKVEHKTDSRAHKAEHEAEHKTDSKAHKAEHEAEHKTGDKGHNSEHKGDDKAHKTSSHK
ncbi:MAG: hypothetical protein NVS2B12_21000 [Ktedonobacteraceae bacterium]